MTVEDFKIQVQTLSGGNWSADEESEIDLILSALENNESESSIRSKISTLSKCPMLITLCSRF
jgi:hypothetical protein